MSHLTIISHTEHYLNEEGVIVGWGSTVTEINHLLQLFDSITHVAMLHGSPAPPSALPYCSDKIKFVAIPNVGGPKIADKISIVLKLPHIIGIIRRQLKASDYFQFRAPTGIGVAVIPYLILFSSNKGWFKYAGNWRQQDAPLAYRLQKWLLVHQSRKVTINGFWDDQPQHCLSFENPCLTQNEVEDGKSCIITKRFEDAINFCFVGRLESAKGVDLIIEAILKLNLAEQHKIGIVHLVGDGEQQEFYKKKTEGSLVQFLFHGFLSRSEVQEIYKSSHAILLPSASEGFPKVIAEAINYGCVPIVSDISSIGHYITDGQNGLLLKTLTLDELVTTLREFLDFNLDDFSRMSALRPKFIQKFTYNYYNQHIADSIL